MFPSCAPRCSAAEPFRDREVHSRRSVQHNTRTRFVFPLGVRVVARPLAPPLLLLPPAPRRCTFPTGSRCSTFPHHGPWHAGYPLGCGRLRSRGGRGRACARAGVAPHGGDRRRWRTLGRACGADAALDPRLRRGWRVGCPRPRAFARGGARPRGAGPLACPDCRGGHRRRSGRRADGGPSRGRPRQRGRRRVLSRVESTPTPGSGTTTGS